MWRPGGADSHFLHASHLHMRGRASSTHASVGFVEEVDASRLTRLTPWSSTEDACQRVPLVSRARTGSADGLHFLGGFYLFIFFLGQPPAPAALGRH